MQQPKDLQAVASPQIFEFSEIVELQTVTSPQVTHKEEGILAAAMLAKMPPAFYEFFEVETEAT